MLPAVAWPICGFLTVIGVWSLFFDLRHTTNPSFEQQSTFLRSTQSPLSADLSNITWSNIERIYIFGDSLSSTGFEPRGEQPSRKMPFGNEDARFFLGTDYTKDRPKWIDRIQSNYSQSDLRIYSLAVPTASVERHAYQARPQGIAASPNRITLKEQVSEFQHNFVATVGQVHWSGMHAGGIDINKTSWQSNATLFATWFGVNDVIENKDKKVSLPVGPIFASYSASIERLYSWGARQFLLLNVPPVDRAQEDRKGVIRRDVYEFNSQLERMHAKLASRHPDAAFYLFDVNTLWSDALDKPTKFPQTNKLKKLDEPCDIYSTRLDDGGFARECGAAMDEYFWKDKTHPTRPVHDLTAARVVNDCFLHERPQGYCTGKPVPTMDLLRMP